MMRLWMKAATGLWCVAWAMPGWAADEKVALTPEQARQQAVETFRQAQANVLAIERGHLVALNEDQVKAMCSVAAQRDHDLASLNASNVETLQAKANQAREAQVRCEDARANKERLDKVNRDLLDTSRTMLRHVALDIAQCKGDERSACAAERLGAAVGRLAGLLDTGQAVKALETARADLVKSAADAQKRVGDIKKETADAYPLGDTAVATALANKAALAAGDQGKELRAVAELGRRSAMDTREAVGRAQRASNELVRNTIELLSCDSADKPCEPADRARTQAEAGAADALLAANLALAGTSFQRTKEAGWAATAGAHANLKDRQRSVAFARLLDTYPDARSLVGEANVAQINTSKEGTDATIKLSLGKLGLADWRQHAITLKAPIGDRDRLGSPVSLGYSRYWLRGLPKDKDEQQYSLLWVAGLAPKVDFLTHEYRDPALLNEPISKRSREWTMSAYVGWYWLRNKEPDLHLFTLDVKRFHKHADVEIRCPAPTPDKVPTCFEAEFKAPQKDYTRVFKYQWRTQLPDTWGSFPLSPTFSYDQRSKEKRLELPIYLWRPEGKDQPFNAGIKLDFGSKSADRVGLFVGTNFDLYGLPER